MLRRARVWGHELGRRRGTRRDGRAWGGQLVAIDGDWRGESGGLRSLSVWSKVGVVVVVLKVDCFEESVCCGDNTCWGWALVVGVLMTTVVVVAVVAVLLESLGPGQEL